MNTSEYIKYNRDEMVKALKREIETNSKWDAETDHDSWMHAYYTGRATALEYAIGLVNIWLDDIAIGSDK